MSKELPGQCDVLVVIAHPDDEIFASGTLCLCAEQGFRIALVSVTDGEGASNEVYGFPRAELAKIRRQELALSATALGIEDVTGIGQADIMDPAEPGPGCWDKADLTQKLGRIIQQRDPRLIVTHGPLGGYGHPAHRMVHRCVLDAVNDTAFEGSVFSFCGHIDRTFFTWHFERPSDVMIDARGFLRRRAASLSYHQSQIDFFLLPYFPRTLRKFLSAIFGWTFRGTEAGRRRVPIGSALKFFRLYPIEGLTLHKGPNDGRPHFFTEHFANDSRVVLIDRTRRDGDGNS